MAAAVRCLDAVWKDGNRYQKGGILLGDFFSQGVAQLNLFDDTAPRANATALKDILDSVNQLNGRGTLFFCGAGDREEMADETGDAVAPLDHPTDGRAEGFLAGEIAAERR